MRRLLTLLTLLLASGPLLVQAQTSSAGVDATASKWQLSVNLSKALASPLGKIVLNQIESENPKATTKLNPETIRKLEAFFNMVGLDPQSDISQIIIYGNSFERHDATILAEIGDSTGNLEGLVLAAPGYSSVDLDPNTLLHSFLIESDKYSGKQNQADLDFGSKQKTPQIRVWCALPYSDQQESYYLVASFDRERVVGLSQDLIAQGTSVLGKPLQEDVIASLSLNDLSDIPVKKDNPGSAIAQTIEAFTLNLKSSQERLTVTLDLAACSPVKARQLSQLLTGLQAMVQLAAVEDPKAQQATKLLDGMVVQHTEGDLRVGASLSADYDTLGELIKKAEY